MLASDHHPTSMERYDQICDELAAVMGVINVAFGRLVELTGLALEEGQHIGPGLLSPAHWLAWRTGLSLGRCRDLVRLARRADELPATFGALVTGELTADQAAVVARHVPAAFDASVADFARSATVAQLHAALPAYRFDEPGDDDPVAGPEPEPEPEGHIATGVDDRGWWINGRLPADQGAIIDRALAETREDLWRQRRAEAPEGASVPAVTSAEAMVSVAETALQSAEQARPGSERYLVHLHLEAGPEGLLLATHLGLPLPDHQRRLLLCDPTFRAVIRAGTTPLSVGRKTRHVSRRLRRAVQHRDRGCRLPGCTRTSGLQVHHIWHWEDGGPTDTWNLVTLCATHHRQHHDGGYQLSGNADEADGLCFRDRHGRVLDANGTPIRPIAAADPPADVLASTTPAEGVAQAAATVGIAPTRYQAPSGERLRRWAVHFEPTTGPPSAA